VELEGRARAANGGTRLEDAENLSGNETQLRFPAEPEGRRGLELEGSGRGSQMVVMERSVCNK
jgi:hypothetical protein